MKTDKEVKEAFGLIGFSIRQCLLWRGLLVKNNDVWGTIIMDREIQSLRALALGIQWVTCKKGDKDIKDLVIELAERGNSNVRVN